MRKILITMLAALPTGFLQAQDWKFSGGVLLETMILPPPSSTFSIVNIAYGSLNAYIELEARRKYPTFEIYSNIAVDESFVPRQIDVGLNYMIGSSFYVNTSFKRFTYFMAGDIDFSTYIATKFQQDFIVNEYFSFNYDSQYQGLSGPSIGIGTKRKLGRLSIEAILNQSIVFSNTKTISTNLTAKESNLKIIDAYVFKHSNHLSSHALLNLEFLITKRWFVTLKSLYRFDTFAVDYSNKYYEWTEDKLTQTNYRLKHQIQVFQGTLGLGFIL